MLGLLRRTHLSAPGDLAAVVADQARSVGAEDVVLYLIDYEAGTLVPLASPDAVGAEPQSVAGTVAGRAYASTTVLTTAADRGDGQRLWLPLLDGTERLGTIAMSFFSMEVDRRLVEACERYAHLVAMLLVSKGAYSDVFEVARRRRPATIATELARALAPPLVFATEGVILAGLLEPAYDNGGDAFDYAVNDDVLHMGIFDAMGHGLAAVGVAAFAISAYRNSRRSGHDLPQTYTAMDAAVGEQFPDMRFVTAVIAQLDLRSGELTWINAAHPPPLLIRDARHARGLDLRPATALGVGLRPVPPRMGRASLEPGDMLLLYSDGLTEARDQDGEMFGVAGLTRFIEREAAGGQAAPETLRRLRQTIVAGEETSLSDDATALLVEWRRDTEHTFMPPTVL
jgi:serine phosphatase RsbU (regulator of sigma subunit)